jgi:hypothetical protein
MNSPFVWVLSAVAVAATAVAVWAGPNLVIAIPAATMAVLAAGLLFAGAWIEALYRAPSRSRPGPPHEILRLRLALRSGRLGREEIITTLDRIERTGPSPDLASRSVPEMEALFRLPRTEFLEYLRARLDYIEARL